MNKKTKQIQEIEATQKALRDSIEQTKALAGKAEDLLQTHKRTLEAEAANRSRV